MSRGSERAAAELAAVNEELKSAKAVRAYLLAAADVCRVEGGGSLKRLAARAADERVARAQREEARHLDVVPPGAPLFASTGGLRGLMGIPGFAALWTVRVPARALPFELEAVVCECGAGTALLPGVTECSGRCRRYFLRLADVVLVKRFEASDEVEESEVAA